MIKKQYLLLFSLLTLSGCNPFNERQAQSEEFVREADRAAKAHSDAYVVNLREIKPYNVYRYQAQLEDPFRLREFLIELAEKEIVKQKAVAKPVCEPPKCIPPEPHPKQLLENYELSALRFVGTVNKDGNKALISTPDFGVVSVQVGDYMGYNNGKILAIKEGAIIIQEKVQIGGIWKNKKTLLMITE